MTEARKIEREIKESYAREYNWAKQQDHFELERERLERHDRQILILGILAFVTTMSGIVGTFLAKLWGWI